MSDQGVLTMERSLESQQAVLGSMLIDPDCVSMVLSRLRAEDFLSKPCQTVFLTIQGLFRAGRSIDAITVRESLGEGWNDFLVQLLDITPTAANVEEYVDLLREKATLYHLQNLGQELNAADNLGDAQAILDQAVSLRVEKPGVQAMTFAEGYEKFFDRHDGESQPRYLHWGVPVLDERLFAEPGDMVVIGGYPSDGKTALALQFAAGIGKGHRVGFFSYESTKDKLFDRYIANAAALDYNRIKRNELTERDYKDLMQLQAKLTAPKVTLIDAAGMTVLDIQAYAQTNHFDVVIVDYLQKVPAARGFKGTEFDRVTQASNGLQQFGRLTETTIIALSQLSRPSKEKKGLKDEEGKVLPPTMQDLRSSGQIEQDADIILLLYRDDPDEKDSDRILKIAKNKEGEALDWVRFAFDGALQTFSRRAKDSTTPQVRPVARQRPRQVSFWPEHPSEENPFQEAAT